MKNLRQYFSRHFFVWDFRDFSASFIARLNFGALAASVCFCAIFASRICSASGLTVGETFKLSGSVRAAALGSADVLDYAPGGNPALFDGSDTAYFKFYASPLGLKVFNLGGKYSFGRFMAGAWVLSQDAGDVEIHRLPFEDLVSEAIYTRKLQSDIALSGFCAWAPSSRTSAGLALKYLSSSLLGEYSLSAFAADAGLFWRPGHFAFAALARNIGAAAAYSGSSRSFPLPVSYSTAFAYGIKNILAQASADYAAAEGGKISYSAGAEYRLSDDKIYPLNSMSLRAGLRLPSGRPITFENVSLGFSLGFSRVLMEYAFLALDNAGYSHHIGFSYRFSHQTAVPSSKISQTQKIYFVDGEFDIASFRKLEDIAMTLKENPRYLVRIEGHLEMVDKTLDYFVRSEQLGEGLFVTAEKEAEWVEITLIKR
ncbi:MAG: hypothetical protein QME32_02140 [Endomicrobiia bacterium]|nr:hypothetical protein [Endomicrobiia bacterium]